MKLPILTSDKMSIKGKELLDRVRDDFIGLNTKYRKFSFVNVVKLT